MMIRKLTYKELEQRVKELERERDKCKQIKEALRNSEARLNALSEASFEALFLTEKGVCLDMNRTAERMFGYTRDEMVNLHGVEVIVPEDREQVQNNMLSGYEKPYEVTALRKNGTTFPCEIQARMASCQGRSLRITALRDISERKKTEINLKLYQRIIDYSSDRMSFLDKNYIYQEVNNAYLAAHNKSRDEIVGHSVIDLIGEKMFYEQIKEKLDRCLDGEPIRFECWFDFQAFGKRFMEVLFQPYSENDRGISGVIVVSHDITERKQAEDRLHSEYARFTTVMDALDAVVYTVDMETHELIFANQYARKLFGEIVGKTCWQALQTGKTGPCEFCTNHKLLDAEGKPAGLYVWELQNTITGEWYQCSDQAIRWPDGRMVRLEIATNINDRKQAEEAIRQREQYLSGLNDAAETLLGLTQAVPFQKFVEKIGPASQASRAYVFINHCGPDGELLMIQKAEWCAEGIAPEIDNPLLQSLSYDEWLPRWKDTLKQGEIIKGRVADFPGKERKILEPQGIRVILIIPVMLAKEFAGFIGFDNCVSDREWSDIEQTFLYMAANNLAQAIKRLRSEERVYASLKEKEVLLREIHHRVKNNMQVIISLLRMHSKRTGDKRLREIFNDCRDRINAMSLIHEALYQSDDLARIDFEVYLKKLCRNLSQVYGASGKGIALTVERCNVTLDMDQGIAVGMVICELVSNAFIHAFPLGKGGNVSISLSGLKGDDIELIIQDNGKGLPPEIDILNPISLGLRLAVGAVTRELGGSINVEREGGTRFSIHFKCKRK